MSKSDGDPAFPRPASECTASGTLADGIIAIREQDGMSLRDYFAAAALTGLCANNEAWSSCTQAELAGLAYKQADAMLADRNR